MFESTCSRRRPRRSETTAQAAIGSRDYVGRAGRAARHALGCDVGTALPDSAPPRRSSRWLRRGTRGANDPGLAAARPLDAEDDPVGGAHPARRMAGTHVRSRDRPSTRAIARRRADHARLRPSAPSRRGGVRRTSSASPAPTVERCSRAGTSRSAGATTSTRPPAVRGGTRGPRQRRGGRADPLERRLVGAVPDARRVPRPSSVAARSACASAPNGLPWRVEAGDCPRRAAGGDGRAAARRSARGRLRRRRRRAVRRHAARVARRRRRQGRGAERVHPRRAPTVGGLSTTYLALNQGKRSVRLDLKKQAEPRARPWPRSRARTS